MPHAESCGRAPAPLRTQVRRRWPAETYGRQPSALSGSTVGILGNHEPLGIRPLAFGEEMRVSGPGESDGGKRVTCLTFAGAAPGPLPCSRSTSANWRSGEPRLCPLAINATYEPGRPSHGWHTTGRPRACSSPRHGRAPRPPYPRSTSDTIPRRCGRRCTAPMPAARPPTTYVVIASLVGFGALVAGVITLVGGSEATLATLVVAMIVLWAMSTVRHTRPGASRRQLPTRSRNRLTGWPRRRCLRQSVTCWSS